MGDLLWMAVAWAACFVAGLMPAFAPPNWALIASFRIARDLPFLPLALGGVAAATAGKVGLALIARYAARFLPGPERANAEALAGWFGRRPVLRVLFLVVYSAGPFPSNVLFIAAGAARTPLLQVTFVFLACRAITDTWWAWLATTATHDAAQAVLDESTSWPAILAQVASIVVVVFLFRLPWRRWLGRGGRGGP